MLADAERAAPNALRNLTRGMSRMDAVGVAVITAGVAVLGLADPGQAVWYLLVLPIWIVSRDFGVTIGFLSAALALALAIPIHATQDVAHGAIGYTGLAVVFAAAAAAGAATRRSTRGTWTRDDDERLLTTRPAVVPRREVLSRRELEVMEMIATGAKNSEIADRFVISQNTVKSHVSQILKKLAVANRTQAAYRYTELYGHAPHATTAGSTAPGDTVEAAEIGATSVLPATVSDMPRNDRVRLTLHDGRNLEVAVLEPMRAGLDVGMPAIVYLDGQDHTVGWYVPELELGVDMRHWTP